MEPRRQSAEYVVVFGFRPFFCFSGGLYGTDLYMESRAQALRLRFQNFCEMWWMPCGIFLDKKAEARPCHGFYTNCRGSGWHKRLAL